MSATLWLSLFLLALGFAGTHSASALIDQGHVFGYSFGEGGTAPGQLSGPSQIAVDEATGDLYVIDAGNERVEIFAPAGGGGYTFASEFKVLHPYAIAVDNSTAESDPTRGDVYVVAASEKEDGPNEHEVIVEYSPTTKVTHKLRKFIGRVEGEKEEAEFEEISGLDVDAQGRLWVYWEEEGEIDALSKAPTGNGKGKLVWLPELHSEPEVESRFECFARPVFAVAPDASLFYAGYERENAEEACPGATEEAPDRTSVAKFDSARPEPHLVTREMIGQNTTGAAVDARNGDLYLDAGQEVVALTQSGELIQRFGQGDMSGAKGMAFDASTGQAFAVEPDAAKILVFDPESETSAPTVDSLTAENLSPSSTELRAQIDPRGLASEYHFEYGTEDCATEGACTALPPGNIAASFGDHEVHAVVEGLKPATQYYYRLVAGNSDGEAAAAPSPNTFTTLPSPAVMPDGRGWEMVSPPEKHGGTPEVVGVTRGGVIEASLNGEALEWLATGPIVAEPEGSRSLELAPLLSRRSASGWHTTSLETPHEKGRGVVLPSPSEYRYFSPDLSEALLEPTEPYGTEESPPLAPGATEKTMYVRKTAGSEPDYVPLVTPEADTAGTQFGGHVEFLDATPDLKHVIFESSVALNSGETSGGLFEWESGQPVRLVSILPNGDPAPDETTQAPTLGNAGNLNVDHAVSDDGDRVIFTTGDEKHLYLRDVARNETIEINAPQGHEDTERGPHGNAVAEPNEGLQEVFFQTASSDGSKIFFTDTAALTEDSKLEPVLEESAADLYEFEIVSGPDEPIRGRLSDITAESAVGSADVLNLVLGSSEDASRVYFVANGVLAPGATPGSCGRDPEHEEPGPADATCNLYVSEAQPGGARTTRFITKLSAGDGPDWGSPSSSAMPPLHANRSLSSARVSPDGQFLTFMSDRSLTGYDNHDAVSGEPDEEVYLYDADTQRLSCASCNPNHSGSEWQRPAGVFDQRDAGEGSGLLVDRPELWRGSWLAASLPTWNFNFVQDRAEALYQPRYLSNDGRLYFDTADALVAADTNGKEDVYQFEPDGLGSCTDSGGCIGLISSGTGNTSSVFLDASESGNDVFFMTEDELVATDTDNSPDIYDAHVCETARPCIVPTIPTKEECAGNDSCKGAPGTPPPTATPPASSTFSGPGNAAKEVLGTKTTQPPPKPTPKPLTRKQKLTKALAKCHKDKNKRRRRSCEAIARKRYGSKKTAKKAAKRTTARRGAR